MVRCGHGMQINITVRIAIHDKNQSLLIYGIAARNAPPVPKGVNSRE